VPRAYPLVPEYPTELVHAGETADDEPLEVQLGGYAQRQRHVHGVVIRFERLRLGTAGLRGQDRRLDLEETLGVELAS